MTRLNMITGPGICSQIVENICIIRWHENFKLCYMPVDAGKFIQRQNSTRQDTKKMFGTTE